MRFTTVIRVSSIFVSRLRIKLIRIIWFLALIDASIGLRSPLIPRFLHSHGSPGPKHWGMLEDHLETL
jgi:hypothetical protein